MEARHAWIAGNHECRKWWARLQKVTEKNGLAEVWRCGQIRKMESDQWEAVIKEAVALSDKERRMEGRAKCWRREGKIGDI